MFTSSPVASLFRGDDRHWTKTVMSVGLMLALKSAIKQQQQTNVAKICFCTTFTVATRFAIPTGLTTDFWKISDLDSTRHQQVQSAQNLSSAASPKVYPLKPLSLFSIINRKIAQEHHAHRRFIQIYAAPKSSAPDNRAVDCVKMMFCFFCTVCHCRHNTGRTVAGFRWI